MSKDFLANYDAKFIEFKQTPEYYFPNNKTGNGSDGLTVMVTPNSGETWVGRFAFGENIEGAMSGIYFTPDVNKLCVVSRGRGYLVNVTHPEDYEVVASVPIRQVQKSYSKGLLFFGNYTNIYAYSKHGLKWQSERVAFDGFNITEVTSDTIKGVFSNLEDEEASFEVDIDSGRRINNSYLSEVFVD